MEQEFQRELLKVCMIWMKDKNIKSYNIGHIECISNKERPYMILDTYVLWMKCLLFNRNL